MLSNIRGVTYSKINDSVVQTRIEEYTLVLYVLGGLDLCLWTVRIFYSERKSCIEAGDEEDLSCLFISLLP